MESPRGFWAAKWWLTGMITFALGLAYAVVAPTLLLTVGVEWWTEALNTVAKLAVGLLLFLERRYRLRAEEAGEPVDAEVDEDDLEAAMDSRSAGKPVLATEKGMA